MTEVVGSLEVLQISPTTFKRKPRPGKAKPLPPSKFMAKPGLEPQSLYSSKWTPSFLGTSLMIKRDLSPIFSRISVQGGDQSLFLHPAHCDLSKNPCPSCNINAAPYEGCPLPTYFWKHQPVQTVSYLVWSGVSVQHDPLPTPLPPPCTHKGTYAHIHICVHLMLFSFSQNTNHMITGETTLLHRAKDDKEPVKIKNSFCSLWDM